MVASIVLGLDDEAQTVQLQIYLQLLDEVLVVVVLLIIDEGVDDEMLYSIIVIHQIIQVIVSLCELEVFEHLVQDEQIDAIVVLGIQLRVDDELEVLEHLQIQTLFD